METITALTLLALALWYGLSALRTREQASRTARHTCERMELQFLDDTVACTGVAVVMHRGKPALRRHYEFEYTHDDASRHKGRLVILGTELTGITLEGTQVLQ